MTRPFEVDTTADIVRRPGKSPLDLGATTSGPTCPDIWELSNGDLVVVGRDVTDAYRDRMPDGLNVGNDERLVAIPRSTLQSAADGL